MENSRLQVAVWFLMPIIGLILLMTVIGFRGGLFVIPPVIAIIGLVVLFAWWTNRRGA